MSLFIASTGLVMSPRFLAAHLPVLAAGVFLVVLGKGVLVIHPPCRMPLLEGERLRFTAPKGLVPK